MRDFDPRLRHHLRDEQATVAVGWILLAAHDGHPVICQPAHQSLHPASEIVALRNASIEDVPSRIVELVALRPSPQLLAEIDVAAADASK
jgi:hypothetical protein